MSTRFDARCFRTRPQFGQADIPQVDANSGLSSGWLGHQS